MSEQDNSSQHQFVLNTEARAADLVTRDARRFDFVNSGGRNKQECQLALLLPCDYV